MNIRTLMNKIERLTLNEGKFKVMSLDQFVKDAETKHTVHAPHEPKQPKHQEKSIEKEIRPKRELEEEIGSWKVLVSVENLNDMREWLRLEGMDPPAAMKKLSTGVIECTFNDQMSADYAKDFEMVKPNKEPAKEPEDNVITHKQFPDEVDEAKLGGVSARKFDEPELTSYMDRILSKKKDKSDKFKLPYIHGSNIAIASEEGKKYDLDKLRELIMERPKHILKQNEKMQHSDGTSSIFFNVGLPALIGLAVDEEKDNEFIIINTCPGAGQCKTFCYAMKGGYVQWKASSLSQTRLLNFLYNDPDGFTAKMEAEVAIADKKFGKKGTKVIIRWHDAGDFFSPEYLDLAYKVAEKFPDVDFYAYTKLASVAHSKQPDNFKINFSMGAKPSEERKIDFSKTKHSMVVPKELFGDLITKDAKGKSVKSAAGKMQFASAHDLDTFKDRMVHKYSIDKDSIKSYDEIMRTPKGDKPKWNVFVVPGDGDDSATRTDVRGSYLLFH